jgi:hypothetical protein
VHAGTPFAKKGDIQMALPRLDVPVGLVRWEVFVPEQYSARTIDGNVIDLHRYPVSASYGGYRPPVYAPAGATRLVPPVGVPPGEIRGRVVDVSGGVLPGATVEMRVGTYLASVVSGADGVFRFSNLPPGQVELTTSLMGFTTQHTNFAFDGSPRQVDVALAVGALQETVTVIGESRTIDVSATQRTQMNAAPSINVINLQQRAAGVLPIRVDVPRAGISHEFVKPLVVGDSPTVTLRYKRN